MGVEGSYPMRLTPKKIEEILLQVVREEGMPLIRELLARDNVSEFDLAIKTKQDIKIIRKLLYILYNHNLVSFNRKKDKQKGWYIYYWTLLPESIKFGYFKMKRELLERLKCQLEEERRELFFICNNSCTRLNFDQAMEFEFRCPECGKLLGQDDNKVRVEDLEKKVSETSQEVELILEERRTKRKVVREKRVEKKIEKKQAARKRTAPHEKKRPKKIKVKPKKEFSKKVEKKKKVKIAKKSKK